MPCLVELNGKAWTVAMASDPTGLAERLSQDHLQMVGSAAEDNASCSCGEGNPCASPYSCKDWENRFANAKAAREAKAVKM